MTSASGANVILIQANHETAVSFTKLVAIPERVSNSRGFGVEAHVPDKILVQQLRHRVDFYIDTEKMAHPSRDHQAESGQLLAGLR